jgi:CRISPR-associated protein (TIGR03984 family)
MEDVVADSTGRCAMTTLHYSQYGGLTCADAIAVAARELGEFQVLVSTPSAFIVERVTTSGVGVRADVLETCFSFRAFSTTGELRWELSDGKIGAATLVSVIGRSSVGSFAEVVTSGVINHKYLCWGEVVSVRDGWARLNSGRTSDFEVPIDASIGDLLSIKTTEYLAVAEDTDGNTFVVDELINGFSVWNEGEHEQ